ncbi:MAG: helix-turn-helix domain-containing protein [Blastocatellia bacterium]
MLSIREAAVMLAVSPSTIRVWILAGRIQGARIEESPAGSYWLIPEQSLKNFKKPKRGRPRKPLGDLVGRPRRKD